MPARARGARRPGRVGRATILLALMALPNAQPLGAEPLELVLDPDRTRIRFEVDSTLHRVEGTASLGSGRLRFDPDGGAVAGRVRVDARSLDTGNRLRDRTLHADVLESQRYPELVFRPVRIEALRIEGDRATLELVGELAIHGGRHRLVIATRVKRDGDRLEIAADFRVPYVEWGLESPSSFLLRVDEVVDVHVEAEARLAPAPH